MSTILVLYGAPANPAAFDRHYVERHLPLVRKLPGLTAINLARGPIEAVAGPGLHQVVRLTFTSSEAAKTALTTPEGAAAAQDLANFADGGVQILAFEETAA
jgi:uncharacterized protein (TIGR02118 family)